jgi:pyruvate dehydrogenase E2 component (dihydrolipoamide acetyltransferase)
MSEAVGARGETRIEEPSAAERTIARRVAEARATVPHLELDAEVDVSHIPAGTPLPALLVRACALALREVPRANGAYRDGRFELYSRVNVGVVVARGAGYVTPTVFDADAKGVPELTDEIAALAARAAAGELAAPALAGATFTLWNAGDHGITRAGAVVGPSQAAALAAGALRDVARVEDGLLRPACAMTITLACDHRMLYGARAAAFLAAVKSALETTGTP